MSLSSEQDLLYPLLLKDSIIEMLESAEKMMAKMQEQGRAEGYEDMYCKGYTAGVEFSKDKVKQMFEQFKGKEWSNGLDEYDYENAKAEYEALAECE